MARTTDPFIIADTSGLISLVTSNDRNHQAALTAAKQFEAHSRTVLVPLAVFTETLNVIGKKQGHAAASQTAELLLIEQGPFMVTDTDSEVTPRALRKFRTQPERVSFTDCIVMAVADYHQTQDIFGFDEQFAQAGYRIIEAAAQAA